MGQQATTQPEPEFLGGDVAQQPDGQLKIGCETCVKLGRNCDKKTADVLGMVERRLLLQVHVASTR